MNAPDEIQDARHGTEPERSSSREAGEPSRTQGTEAPEAGGLSAGPGSPHPEPSSAVSELPADALIILCVRNLVLFPGVVLPVSVSRNRSLEAVQEAVRRERPVGLLLQKNPESDRPEPHEIHRVGTLAAILRYIPAPDGSHYIICQGQQRFRVVDFLRMDPFPIARVELLEEQEEIGTEVEARVLNLKEQAREALQLMPQHPAELDIALESITEPALLADMVTTYMDLPPAEKQEILETVEIKARLAKVSEKLASRLDVLRLSREISQRTKGSLDKAQRDYFLREQLKTIQAELGETDAKTLEIAELDEKITRAKMSEEVEKEARKELRRLERMPEAAAEYSMVRTYLEWLIELPWSVMTGDVIDIARARQILDEDHYGLEKIKKRILEHLAVRRLKPDGKSPILCLVGPPGVGKTSLGQSIARAMNRKFVRISLGGVHDEAEIRGHRRTYIGALPGNIIQGIRKAGTRNPVFMLDELDKLSRSFHGDPSSALLEVLDPEQNATFRDNYLGVPFDLSRAMFIGTANVLDAIPGPLRDRCEVIHLPGYTEEEKLQIAKRYLVKRQIDANGLNAEQIHITDDALRSIIRRYTREAGCRNLEREIGAVCRSVATRFAEGRTDRAVIDEGAVREILGPQKFENEVALRTSIPGVATGLAWTAVGGEILFVEATRMPGKGELILTGQLGDVMKESARAAISLVKARAEALGVSPATFEKSDIHIHIPAGAIPKDGPSAGITLYVALVSLLTRRKVSSDVAMSGEISLRGLVLPVGGIKEKVLAATAAGIQKVVLPARNEKDLEDVPASARQRLDFAWVETVDEALQQVLEQPAAEPAQVG
jgi:ATP-dependent Lon protease